MGIKHFTFIALLFSIVSMSVNGQAINISGDQYHLYGPNSTWSQYLQVGGKHLPEVPSAKEFERDGMAVGEMNRLLLKKIEELTLHLIEQKRDIDQVKFDNEAMKLELQKIKEKK